MTNRRCRVQFNTGRMYAAEGQVIVAETAPDGIRFNDTTRDIQGLIPTLNTRIDSPSHLADVVTAAYDNGIYGYCSVLDAPTRDAAELVRSWRS